MATYVKVKLSAANGIPALKETVKLINYTINTINGKYGNGEDRKKALGKYYTNVQAIINYMYTNNLID